MKQALVDQAIPSLTSDVTHLLARIESGDPIAADQLLPLVYDELRKLAAARMAQERPDHSLDATGLVHQAYLRLLGDQQFDNRGHFFAAAAEAMRRILVNHALDRNRHRRCGGGFGWNCSIKPMQFCSQLGMGVFPVPVSRSAGFPHGFAGLPNGKSGK